MKMRLKMKGRSQRYNMNRSQRYNMNRSQRYNMNRPRPRHLHKYNKYNDGYIY